MCIEILEEKQEISQNAQLGCVKECCGGGRSLTVELGGMSSSSSHWKWFLGLPDGQRSARGHMVGPIRWIEHRNMRNWTSGTRNERI